MNLWPSASRLEQALKTAQTMRRRVDATTMKFLNFFTPRRTGWMASGLLVAFFFVSALHANALTADELAAGGDKMASWVFIVLNNILLAIVQTVGQLASIVVSLLVAISSFNKFSTVRVVDIGWTIVKDVSNMLFIIALLVIAAGTVLRLENYKYNRLLSNLIIMAFLTNFSRFIAAFFIQGAQVLMLTFANAYKDALYGNFVSGFGLDQILRFRPDADTLTQTSVFSNLLAGLVLTVIALIITAAICVVLFARIVALWILVILSPFAFASQILPNTKSFSTRWWSEFGKYVTQGPILAFFLWLALAIVSVGSGATSVDPSLGTIAADLQARQGESNFFQIAAFTFDNLMTFVISGAFLVFGLNYATSSSGAAGKWAGKVASAGFAGAATVSGINAIRDRTIAPVQGWIKNRGAARNAAIQERTQTLEAAGDRVRARIGDQSVAVPFTGGRARIGPGRAGAEKSQAAANAYERQRTQRFAQGRGFTDMTEQELQTRMQSSTDRRERLAALTELQGRGRINLRDPNQDGAFNQIMAQNRIPPADARKLREQILSANVGAMDETAVRGRLAVSTDQAEQIVLAKELERRRALNADVAGDVGILNQLRNNLNGIPQQLKEFDDALKRSNPRMALETIYNNFANGLPDAEQLVSDLQQGTFNGANLTIRDIANVSRNLRNSSGMNKADAQSWLGNEILSRARSQEEYNRISNSLQGDTRDIINNDLQLAPTTVPEKRRWLADQAYIGEAYQGNVAAQDYYIRENPGQVLKNLKEERISRATWNNEAAVEAMINQERINVNDLVDATKNVSAVRDSATTTLSNVVSRYNRGATANTDDSTTEGRRQNKIRRSLVAVSGGGNVDDPFSMGPMPGGRRRQISSLESAFKLGGAATTAAITGAQSAMERFVVTSGNKLTRMDWNNLRTSPNEQVIKRAVVENLKVGHLADIDEKNPGLSREIYNQTITLQTLPAGTVYGGQPLTPADLAALGEKIKTIRRSDRLPF